LHALGLHEGGQLFAQRVVPFRRAILQRGTRFMGQRGVDRLADALHIKHGRIWKAAREADDAGLAQQLEEFTDGGGFHMVQAGGELEWHGSLKEVAGLKLLSCDGSVWAAASA